MAYTEFTGELDDEQPTGYVEFSGELDKPESKLDKVKSALTPKPSIAERAESTPPIKLTPSQSKAGRTAVAKAFVSGEPIDEEGGFVNSAARTVGQNIKGAGQLGTDYLGADPNNAVKKYGQAIVDANPTAVNSLPDIAAKPGTAVAEATGNAAPSMAGMVGARAVGQGITALSPLAGPLAPVVAAAGQVVSWLGPAAIAALPSYGGIREKQILNDPKNEKDSKAIAVATMGAAAVGAIEQAFGPQQWALAAMTKEGRAKLAEKFAATSLAGSVGKGAVKGAAIEGAEELAQNPIEQLASFDNPTTPENLKETVFGGAMGALGGGVLGGGGGMILGKPATQLSDRTLRYTAKRGGEKARKVAQAELDRREKEGVDPAISGAKESTPEATARIIATGRDKATDISKDAAEASESIQDDIFDEPDHVGDANKMVNDDPTPEPIETLNAQLNALDEGRKPGVLLTPGEALPDTLPDGVKSAEIPDHGILLYRDDAVLHAALGGQLGTALGYGIDEKPTDATHTVTARDENGTVIQDVATDGSANVVKAATIAAGPKGSVEVRPIKKAMAERKAKIKVEKPITTPPAKVKETQPKKEPQVFQKPGKPEPLKTDTIPSTGTAPTPSAGTAAAPDNGTAEIRPIIESLIKRRAAAKQINKEKHLDNALVAAKQMLSGGEVKPAKFKKAAAMLANDPATAAIVMQLHDKAKAAQKANKAAVLKTLPEPAKPATTLVPEQAKKEPDPALSRSTAPAHREHVEKIVQQTKANWKNSPDVVILDSLDDAPAPVRAEDDRQLSQGASGTPEGFIHRGKVYIVASEMKSPKDVSRVLLHESLGHYGLRGVFGEDLHKILKQVAALRRKDIEAKAEQYGFDMSKESDRLMAAEEVLAEMAETNPQISFVQRALAAIRAWLRKNIPGFDKMNLSDAEMIKQYLIPARNFVKNSRGSAPSNDSIAFRRSAGASANIRSGKETLIKYGLDPGKRYKTRDIAAALEARQRDKYGKINPKDRSDETAKKIGQWMADEVEFEMQHPTKSGVGWYSEKFQRGIDVMATEFPELLHDKAARDIFTALIAITSDGQKVVPNFAMAADLYGNFKKTGQFTTERGHARQASINNNLRVLQELHGSLGSDAMHEYLMEEQTVAELKAIAKETGAKFSTSYQVHIKLPRAAVVLGPKLGAFYANLMGSSGYLTMDRWWSRTFNRYRGTLLQAPTREGLDRFKQLMNDPSMSDDGVLSAVVGPRDTYAAKGFKNGTEIEKAANTIYKTAFENLEDAPFNSTDRTFMLKAVSLAQKDLARKGVKISVADIQAVLWYYEKRLYGELGAKQTADISYEDAAKRVIADRANPDRSTGRAVRGTGESKSVNDARSVGTEDFESLPPETSFSRSRTLDRNGTSDTSGERGRRADSERPRAPQELAKHESLPGLPSTSPGANPDIIDLAAVYMRSAGITPKRQTDYVKVKQDRATAIADAYAAMKHAPKDPGVIEAYDALAKETMAQWQAIKKLGLKIEFIKGKDPYTKGPIEVLYDIRDNKHMWVFPTDLGFGSDNAIPDNPLLAPTDEIVDGRKMVVNDIFRIVHDIFGHAKEGNGFGPVGEENAWQSHAIMYSPLALKAMTTETRGQNSWVNYGPHGEHNRSNPKETIYADQKVGILPAWVMSDGRSPTTRIEPPETSFSRAKTPQGGQPGSWDAPEPSKIDDIIYKLQNKHIDLKRVLESVHATGAQLGDKWNTYLQEELFHGRAAKRTQDFVNKELKPITVAMKLRGQTVDELDKFLHARHAEEANNLIAQRDPNMPDGGSGMTTKEAKAYLAGIPADKLKRLENTAKMVDTIITKTRDLYVSYGLIDQATALSWEKMFKHYVPLMREDNDSGMGVGQGFSVKGKEAKHRTGSSRKVVDILANIAMQREKAIVRGEKNRVAVSLAGLAKLNPNPDFWTFTNAPKRHYNEKTGMIEERADPLYKNRDNVIVAKIKDSNGNIQEKAIIFQENNERAMRMAQAMKNLDATQLEGLLGVSAHVTRYFASINTQYNPIFGVINLTRDLQASLLNLSSTRIAGSKAQVLKNILPAIRAIYSSARGARKSKTSTSPMGMLWDEMQLEGGMTGYRDLFKTSEDRANSIKRELDPTAWMNNGLGKVFTAGGALKVPLSVAQKKAGWIFDWLSDYNQTLEGAMRLSVYKAAIDKGLSKPQAASIAKNISVNFNRKGQSGQQAGALYAFFNAAMQGTARIGETMTKMEQGDIKTLRFNRAGKTIIAGGITLGVLQALALSAAGFDDDEPPEFVRERSLIIPIGDKKYLTIPMPLGFHAIPNLGRLSTEFALGGFKNPADYTTKLFTIFAEAFNPIGSSSTLTQTISPTITDPLVALAENKDWTGKPIFKEDFNQLSPTPGFSRNKDTATDPAKWIAEAINTLSGGNKYVPGKASPTADQIDYLFGQLTGGVGREAGKAQQSLKAVTTGEDLPPHKIPLVGRFYGDASTQTSQGNTFYSNLKRLNEIEAQLKGMRKDKLSTDEFKAENPEWRLVTLGNVFQRRVSEQRKIKSDLIKSDAPREQVKAVDARITDFMGRLNSRVKELKQTQHAVQ